MHIYNVEDQRNVGNGLTFGLSISSGIAFCDFTKKKFAEKETILNIKRHLRLILFVD